jgi:hypothetical protein
MTWQSAQPEKAAPMTGRLSAAEAGTEIYNVLPDFDQICTCRMDQ